MSVTIGNITDGASPHSALVSWSSTLPDPTFYVYLDGVFLYRTKRRSANITMQPDQAGLLEVFDDPTEMPSTTKPSDGIIRFSGNGSEAYRIEKLVDAVWETKQERIGSLDSHRYRTDRINDVADDTFRITALSNGLESTPTSLTAGIVRVPDPPEADYSFNNSTKQLTVAVQV